MILVISRLAVLGAAIGWLAPAAAQDSAVAVHSSWRIQSFAEVAGLTMAALFEVEFEADGTVWVAASNGLYRSHGYVWRRFTTADGLPSDYVRCLELATDGSIWIGTDRGLVRYRDGRFLPVDSTRLPGPSVRRIVQQAGGTMWFCCDRWPDASVSAGLGRLRDGEWKTFGIDDGLPADYVSDVVFDSSDRTFVLTRRGLAQFDGNRFHRPLETAGLSGASDYFWSLVEDRNGGLLAASTNSLFQFDGREWRRLQAWVHGLRNPQLLRSSDGAILACSPEHEPRFVTWDGATFVPVTEPFPFRAGDIQDLTEAPDGSIWAAGRGFLARWERKEREWREHPELPRPQLADRDGGIWFGDKHIVRRHAGESTRFEGRAPVMADAEGCIWWSRGADLCRWDSKSGVSVTKGSAIGLRSPEPAVVDGAGSLYAFDTVVGEACVVARCRDGQWLTRPLVAEPGWSTELAVGDPKSGAWFAVSRNASSEHRVVFVDDDVTRELALPEVARSMYLPRVLVSRAGDVWIFGFFGLYRSTDRGRGSWERIQLPGGHVFNGTERDDGIWFAHLGTTGGSEGLARYADGEWTHVAADVDGSDPFGDVEMVFPTKRGKLIILSGSPRKTRILTLPMFADVQSVVSGQDGELWLGTDQGVLHFVPDGIPPDTVVRRAPTELIEGGAVTMDVIGLERFYAADNRPLRVQTRVDGQSWQEQGRTDSLENIEGLSVGTHAIEVRVIDEAGDVDPTPATLTVRVKPAPMQSRPWFWPVVAGLFVVMLALAVYGFVARRRLYDQARGLENAVRDRTADLQLSEEKYRVLFEQSRDAIFLLTLDGRIADGNPAACELTRSERASLRGQLIHDLFDEPLTLPDVAKSGGSPPRLEPRQLTRELGRQHVFLGVDLRRDQAGEPMGFQVIARDVTAGVELDERLHNARKMEAIGRMSGAIAHDFNNLLTGMLGFSDLLAQRVSGDPALERNVENIIQSALRAKELTGQIRSFSRGEVSAPRTVAIDHVLAGMDPLIRSLVSEDVQFQMNLGARDGWLRIDPGRLEQVVTNLVVNADAAMAKGGVLQIETAIEDEGERVVLYVVDNGTGMSRDIVRKAFEPFFTTKPHGVGSGLGLAIVYGIVDRSSGVIDVESRIGDGTRIRVAWPRLKAPTVPAPDVDRAALEDPAESPQASARILVVEDDAAVCDLLRTCLEQDGHEVTTAFCGEDALALLDAGEFGPDLVISDVSMPGMNGPELVDRLRERFPGLPALLISGYTELHDRLAATAATPVLGKPSRPSALLARVREMLQGA